MKKQIKKVISLCIVITLLVCAFSSTAFAADSTVTYKGRKSGFEFASDSIYTDTDLFDNFKNVMPGDKLNETVTIKNQYSGCDYIKVWMGAVLHDEQDNPISTEVLKELQDRKASSTNADDKAMTDLEYMHDFLDQFNLTVWNGEKTDKNIIYKGQPSSLSEGFEDGNVYIGALDYKENMKLYVELEADIEKMDNRYADRIGEVDWVFVIREVNESSDGPDGDRDPKPGTTSPQGPGSVTQPEAEPEVDYPQILPNVPKTGDDTVVWPYVTLLGVGVVGMILTLFKKRKKENE